MAAPSLPFPVREVALNVLTPETLPSFDSKSYSLFKYGDVSATTAYAVQVAAKLRELLTPEQRANLVLSSSAWVKVPTAATVLVGALHSLWNAGAAGAGAPPAAHVKIQRGAPTQGDYSQMSVEQRAAVMAANKLQMPPPAALEGRHFVIVDDSRITGSHEKCLLRAIAESGVRLASLTFLYIVAVPQRLVASADPAHKAFVSAVEDTLNHAHVRGLRDLAPILSQPGCQVTARTIKFVLQHAATEGADAMRAFLAQLPLHVAVRVLDGAVADGVVQPKWRPVFEAGCVHVFTISAAHLGAALPLARAAGKAAPAAAASPFQTLASDVPVGRRSGSFTACRDARGSISEALRTASIVRNASLEAAGMLPAF